MIIPPCVRIEGCTPPSDSSMDDPDNHDADLDQCEIPWALEWGFFPRVLNPKIPMKNTFKSQTHTSHDVDLGMNSCYIWVPIPVEHDSLFKAIRLPKIGTTAFFQSTVNKLGVFFFSVWFLALGYDIVPGIIFGTIFVTLFQLFTENTYSVAQSACDVQYV